MGRVSDLDPCLPTGVIAFDASAKSTGWCAMSKCLIDYGEFSPLKEDFRSNLSWILRHLGKWPLVIIEHPKNTGNASTKSMSPLIGSAEHLRFLAKRIGVRDRNIAFVNSSEWRARLWPNVKAPKENRSEFWKEMSTRHADYYFGWSDSFSTDAAEAICIADLGMKTEVDWRARKSVWSPLWPKKRGSK